jgi:hypothetical protein
MKKLLLFLIFLPIVFGHVPVLEENSHSLNSAFYINEPLKSWVYYTELHEGGEAYYSFNLSEGDTLVLSLTTIDKNFIPNMILLGPDLPPIISRKPYIETPMGYGGLFFPGEAKAVKEYEPFTPTSYYFPNDVRLTVNNTGIYYLVIYEPSGLPGKTGLAIGYEESFTLTEWLKTAIDLLKVHAWEGQPWMLIIYPYLATLAVGLLVLKKMKKKLLLFAALLYFASSAATIMQMLIALIGAELNASIIITIVFALMPAVLGSLLLKESNKIKVVLYSILGLFTWSGLLVGPVLAFTSIFFKEELKNESSKHRE